MFDIGWSELVIIGMVALVVIGPKELPTVLRTVGQWMGKVRRMASEFQGQFQEAMREAEVADLKRQFDEAASAASNAASGLDNPLETARKEIETTFEQGTREEGATAAPESGTANPPPPESVPVELVPAEPASPAPQSEPKRAGDTV